MNSTLRTVIRTGVMMLAAMALPVRAGVINGGFETGTLSGWTQIGDTSFSGVDPFAARFGAFGAFFGPTAPGGISQSFATISGTAYKVDFWLSLADSAQPNSFAWSWNGVPQTPLLNNATAFGYTEFSGITAATGAASTLAFTFTNPQSFWLLDNVSVEPVSGLPGDGGSRVPEPGTAGLMLVGLAAMGWMRLRAKQRA